MSADLYPCVSVHRGNYEIKICYCHWRGDRWESSPQPISPSMESKYLSLRKIHTQGVAVTASAAKVITLTQVPHCWSCHCYSKRNSPRLGHPCAESLDFQRVDPTYRLVFDDGSQLALTSDMKSMQEQLETFEPGSFQGFLRYMDEGHRHYHLGIEKLVNRDFRKASEFFTLENIPLVYQLKPFVNHYGNMSAYFDDPRLKTAFTFQDVYMG